MPGGSVRYKLRQRSFNSSSPRVPRFFKSCASLSAWTSDTPCLILPAAPFVHTHIARLPAESQSREGAFLRYFAEDSDTLELLYPSNNPQFHAIGSVGVAVAGLLRGDVGTSQVDMPGVLPVASNPAAAQINQPRFPGRRPLRLSWQNRRRRRMRERRRPFHSASLRLDGSRLSLQRRRSEGCLRNQRPYAAGELNAQTPLRLDLRGPSSRRRPLRPSGTRLATADQKVPSAVWAKIAASAA